MHLKNAFNFFETCWLSCKNMKFGSSSNQEGNMWNRETFKF